MTISRKIIGKDKDICYTVNDIIRGVIVNNILFVTMVKDAPRNDLKQLNAMLKKAKTRDGVKYAKAAVGEIKIIDNDVNVAFEEDQRQITDFVKDSQVAA